MLKMLVAGCFLAALGWLISCGTTIYNVENITGMTENEGQAYRNVKFADNPVIPSREQLAAWKHKLAEPPFFPPPSTIDRKWNYWMMSQRAGSLSYLTFSAGFSLLVFTIFVWLADVRGIRFGVFRTLGVNALAGYMLASITGPLAEKWITELGYPVEKTAPVWPVAASFFLHFFLIYAVLRLMEWRKIYLRM
jgi:hypothetical protein